MVNYPRKERQGIGRFVPSWKLVLGSLVFLGVLLVGGFAAAVYLMPVPEPNDVAVAESTKVMYSDGKREIGRLGDVRRTNIPLSDVPESVQLAILAAEDNGFYDHGGFDPEGIGRAFWNNVTGGDTQGGSTITQQYVKNAYLTHEQSLIRKMKEMVLAVKVETVASKEEILGNYLNTIYFGRGCYGVECAAETFYGKHAKALTLDEGIALAAMVRSPGNYDPKDYPERLQERMFVIRDAMLEKGWINQKQANRVSLPKFKPKKRANQLAGQNGYILEAVRREMTEVGWSEAELEGGGLTIVTTIDKEKEEAATNAVAAAGPSYNNEGLRIGLAAVEPGTGEIKAIYGGADYLDDQLDNAMQGRAPAGSTFKPFALAAGIESGYGLSSIWNGTSPATVDGYTLQNYGNSSFGPVSLLQATQHSINTAYVQLEAEVGVDKVIDAAYRAGLPKKTPGIEENLTFVLGTASPRPIDMAVSFATFAADGVHAEPTILKEVKRSGGETAYRIGERGEERFDTETIDTVNQALQAVVNSGTGSRASWIGRPVAGKTGSTDGQKSAWFSGYTPQLAASVMLTKEDSKGNPISLAGTGGLGSVGGSSFPTAIFAEFMKAALEGEPVESFSDTSTDWGVGGDTGSSTSTTSPSQSPSESPSATSSSGTPSPTQSSSSAAPSAPTSSASSSSGSGSSTPSPVLTQPLTAPPTPRAPG